LVGHDLGGLAGAEAAQVLPAILEGLFARRRENVVRVTEEAVYLAGLDGPQLAAWVHSSDEHAAYLQAALEAAYDTLDEHKLRTFTSVLADGLQDDARLDMNQLVLAAVRELDAPHLRVLDTMGTVLRNDTDRKRDLDAWSPWLLEVHGHKGLAEGLVPILVTLERTACVRQAAPENWEELSTGERSWMITPFGTRCLDFIRRTGESDER
jgi:hypothetical protein